MIAAAHPASLKLRHAVIETDLDSELRRPLPDFVRVKRLKQLKLRIKDKLAAHRANDPPHARP